MRHLKRTAKLGRTGEHRNAMLANLVCSLIKHKRVTTTLAKAKAARSVAEKMVTLGKNGTIHDRRLAAARLHQEDAVKILFNEIAPAQRIATAVTPASSRCTSARATPRSSPFWNGWILRPRFRRRQKPHRQPKPRLKIKSNLAVNKKPAQIERAFLLSVQAKEQERHG